MGSTFTELIVDANDPVRLAGFWCAVLGWRTTDTYDPHSADPALEIADPDGGRPTIVFVPVPESKSVKNRMHIDVSPRGSDQAAEVERLIGLGARRVDIGQGDRPWVVLADPEGNEFCVLRDRVDQTG